MWGEDVMSIHEHKDGRWFVRYGQDGKDLKRYFGRGDIAREQAIRFDEELKRQSGKLNESGLTVTQLCNHYIENHPVQPSTRDSDFYRLDRIILPVLGDIPTDSLTSQHLNAYVKSRLEAGRKRRTIARELDILRSAFNWAQSQEPPLTLYNPLAKFRLSGGRDSEIPAPPTPEEIKSILQHAPPHLVRALVLGWSLGMRPGGEISRIVWGDVDFYGWKIRIVAARKGSLANDTCRFPPWKTVRFETCF
jgi:integrase